MIHQKLLLIVLVLIISACKVKSDFLTDCTCDKLRANDGIEVTDHYDRYSVRFPNEEWEPYAHNNEMGDGIVGGLFKDDSFKIFGVIELKKADNWETFEKQQAEIEKKYNVLDSGFIEINGMNSYWNLVDDMSDSIPILTLYVTTVHPVQDFFYTLNLSVSKNYYGRKELCELESLLQTFKTK